MTNEKKGGHMAAESTTATPEQVAGWKKQYGEDKVFVYEADGKKCWLRTPDRKIIGFAAVTARDNLAQKEIVIRQCWLAGDAELVNDDRYFFGLAAVIDELTEVVQGELKKA